MAKRVRRPFAGAAGGDGSIMRLICPNCEAQYEVDDGAIPEGGRDVQCSGCGHAWFQLPPAAVEGAPADEQDPAEAPEEDAALEADAPAIAPDEPGQGGVAAPGEPAGQTGSALHDGPAEAGGAGSAESADPAGQGPRPKLDESVLSVLREEAERESKARRAEAERIETQPDLGLTGEPLRPRRPVTGTSPEPTDAQEDKQWPPPRKRLPEIDEIHSTLGPAEGQGGEAPQDAAAAALAAQYARRRRGFRIGFLLVFVGVLAALGLYAFAPQIVALVPDAEPAVTEYVRVIDDWRMALDARLDAAMRALTAAITDGDA